MSNFPIQRRALLAGGSAVAFIPLSAPSHAVDAPRRSEKDLAARYLDAWRTKDIASLRHVIGEQIRFVSPTASSTGGAAYLAAATKFFPLYRALSVRAIVADVGQAMVAYDLDCIPPIGICPTAELLTIANGRIIESKVYFDARPFAALSQRAPKQ